MYVWPFKSFKKQKILITDWFLTICLPDILKCIISKGRVCTGPIIAHASLMVLLKWLNVKEIIIIKETNKNHKGNRRGQSFWNPFLTWLFFPFPEIYRKRRGIHTLGKQSDEDLGFFVLFFVGFFFWQKQMEVVYQQHCKVFHFPHVF